MKILNTKLAGLARKKREKGKKKKSADTEE